jgi:chromosomal replication initiator protein
MFLKKTVEHSETKNMTDFLPQLQESLKAKYGNDTFISWFGGMELANLDQSSVVFAVPSRFIRDWILANYAEGIRKVVNENNPQIIDVEIIIKGKAHNVNIVSNGDPAAQSSNQIMSKPEALMPSATDKFNSIASPIDPQLNFDNFIIGEENRIAYTAAKTLAESHGERSNLASFFLYAPVGLGKTHLLHAVAGHIKSNFPTKKVVYLSAERFMYHFVKHLRGNDIMGFKDIFKTIDILLIDDFQFISGKEGIQEELLHVFNVLAEENKQIIFACDRAPNMLKNVNNRILSRISGGLVVDIKPISYELRKSILTHKASKQGFKLSSEVVDFIASNIGSSVRDIEGALNRIFAYCGIMFKEVNVDNIAEILRDLINTKTLVAPSIDDIQRVVSKIFDVSISSLKSKVRVRNIAIARQVAMYLAKEMTPESLVRIGREFGGRDHATVLHAVKKVNNLRNTDLSLQDNINKTIQILHS